MSRIFAWFRAHRITTWSLRVVLVLWGIHEWLNWAAEREWRRYCDAARARGVKLTLAEFAPPEIPDAENFAALPMFQAAFAAPSGTPPNPFELPQPPSGPRPSGGDLIKGTPIDWIAWQQFFKTAGFLAETTNDPIADMLRGLDHYRALMDEWRGWKQRPRCRFPVDWNTDPFTLRMPMFSTLRGATEVFGWRMRAHLAQHDSAAALEDFRDAFQTYRALRDEPTLIAGGVRVNALTLVNARIGNGLAEHAWAEPDLRALDAELVAVRLWDDYRLAMSSERIFTNAMHEKIVTSVWWEKASVWNLDFPDSPDVASRVLGLLISRHKVRDNQLRANNYIDELLARVTERGLDFDRPTPSGPDDNGSFFHAWHYIIFKMLMPIYGWNEQRYHRVNVQLHQTRLAIALERFHLARGVFPETLDALVPEFLDAPLLDPWSGKSMIYRRAKTDSFLLYSVGKDRKDDDGMIDTSKHEYSQRDAIWLYAPP